MSHESSDMRHELSFGKVPHLDNEIVDFVVKMGDLLVAMYFNTYVIFIIRYCRVN